MHSDLQMLWKCDVTIVFGVKLMVFIKLVLVYLYLMYG